MYNRLCNYNSTLLLKWALVMCALLVTNCCSADDAETWNKIKIKYGPRIAFVNSCEYRERVKSFKISVDDARKAIVASKGTGDGIVLIGSHYMIIDNYYIFSPREDKQKGVNIGSYCYCVDGKTGAVIDRGWDKEIPHAYVSWDDINVIETLKCLDK